MNFVTTRDLRLNPKKVFDELSKEKEAIIISKGKPVALMSEIKGSNLEEILKAVRKTRAQLAVKSMRETAKRRGLASLSTAQINAEIRKARKG